MRLQNQNTQKFCIEITLDSISGHLTHGGKLKLNEATKSNLKVTFHWLRAGKYAVSGKEWGKFEQAVPLRG